nr:alkaline phosphatase [Haliscomenobacter sp.]
MAINEDSKMNAVKPKFTTNGHTGTLIPVYAFGPKAELFSGIYENTAIYHKMREALGWGATVLPKPMSGSK